MDAYEKDELVRGEKGGPIGVTDVYGRPKPDAELSREDLELLGTVAERDPHRYTDGERIVIQDKVRRLLPQALSQREIDIKKNEDSLHAAHLIAGLDPEVVKGMGRSA